jgi:hypothetical protein
MFRPPLGHLQALKKHRYKIIQVSYINALWDPKCSQYSSFARSLPQFMPTYDHPRQRIPDHSSLPTRPTENQKSNTNSTGNHFPRTSLQPQYKQNRRRLFSLMRHVKTPGISNFTRSGISSQPLAIEER